MGNHQERTKTTLRTYKWQIYNVKISGTARPTASTSLSSIAEICHEISMSHQKDLEEAIQKLCKTESYQVCRGRVNVLLHIVPVTRKETEADEFSMSN